MFPDVIASLDKFWQHLVTFSVYADNLRNPPLFIFVLDQNIFYNIHFIPLLAKSSTATMLLNICTHVECFHYFSNKDGQFLRKSAFIGRKFLYQSHGTGFVSTNWAHLELRCSKYYSTNLDCVPDVERMIVKCSAICSTKCEMKRNEHCQPPRVHATCTSQLQLVSNSILFKIKLILC